eukprot:sb/3470048/
MSGRPARRAGGKYDRRMSFDDVKDERMLMMVDKLCIWMGGLICKLAEVIQDSVDDCSKSESNGHDLPSNPPQAYNLECSARSMEARENVMKFMTWARELRVPESSIFSPDDLLKLKGKMNVVNTLLAVARRAKDCGMAADIDAPPKIANAFKGLEEKFGKKFDHTAAAFNGPCSKEIRKVSTTLLGGSAWKMVQQKIDTILQLPGKPGYEIFRA